MTRFRVVLAEDHPGMADELKALLDTDYDVAEIVGDGRSLVEASMRAQPDAVVSDVAMPGLSGLVAAEAILARRPGTPIVLVTVQDSPAVIRRALSGGVRGYVIKSDAGRELVDAVAAVIAGGDYVSATARRALDESRRRGGDEGTAPRP